MEHLGLLCRHNSVRICLLGSAFLIVLAAVSVPAETQPPLSWTDCLRLAASRNPELLAAIHATDASKAGYYGSYNALFPSLNLSASRTEGSNRSRASRWQAGGTASLDLFDLGNFASIRSASAELEGARANLQGASAEVLSDLARAFVGLLFAQEQIGLSNTIRDVWKRNAEMISLRYDSGRESKGNRMRTEAELVQAEIDTAQSGRDLRVAQQTLNQALGNDSFVAVNATGSLVALPVPPHPLDLEALVEQHPRVVFQRAALAQARAALTSAQSSLLPRLSANYSRSYVGPDFFPNNPSWTAQGVVSYSLFGEGPTAAYYAIAAAKRNVERSQEEVRAVRHEVRTELETAWSNYARAQDHVRVQRLFLQAAEQRRR